MILDERRRSTSTSSNGLSAKIPLKTRRPLLESIYMGLTQIIGVFDDCFRWFCGEFGWPSRGNLNFGAGSFLFSLPRVGASSTSVSETPSIPMAIPGISPAINIAPALSPPN